MSEAGRDYVVYGMRARCSEGTMDNYISTDTGHGVVYQGCPLLNANDHTAQVNLTHFGDCNSKKIYEDAKKQVDEKYASEAGEGFFSKAAKWVAKTVVKVGISVKEHLFFHKCELDTPLPWIYVNEEHMIDGAPALTIDSQCACRFGGIITIVPPETEEVEVTTGEGTMETAMAENAQEAEITTLSEEAEASEEQKEEKSRMASLPNMRGGIGAVLWGDAEERQELLEQYREMLEQNGIPNMRGGIGAFLMGDAEERQKLLEQYRKMLEQKGIEIPEEPVVYAVVGTDKNRLPSEQQVANAKYIYNYLLNEGWSENAIFGLLGNIEHESHLNPGTWRKLDNTSAAYGLAQWLKAPDLYAKMREFVKENLSSINVQSAEDYEIADRMAEECPLELMNLQLEYLIETCTTTDYLKKRWWPVKNDNCPYKMTYEEYIADAKHCSAEDMALVFHESYERSGNVKSFEERKLFAGKWRDYFQSEQTGEE